MNNEQKDFDVKVEYRKQGMTLIGSYKHIHDARKFSGYNEVDAVELFKRLLKNKYIQQALSIKNLADSEEVIQHQFNNSEVVI